MYSSAITRVLRTSTKLYSWPSIEQGVACIMPTVETTLHPTSIQALRQRGEAAFWVQYLHFAQCSQGCCCATVPTIYPPALCAVYVKAQVHGDDRAIVIDEFSLTYPLKERIFIEFHRTSPTPIDFHSRRPGICLHDLILAHLASRTVEMTWW